ncbi:MAG: glycoside hydrolase family protein [Cupriavidus sp.]|nr:glycoside hydrolase family protein [Cupriavidus sp.]
MSGNGAKVGTGIGAGLVLCSAVVYAFLGRWEDGTQLTVYADKLAQGLPTVCRGLTRHVTRTPIIVGETWSAEKCEAEERRAIVAVQTNLLRCFTRNPSQAVFDAATSHAWNFGAPATCGSAAMRAWNAGEWQLGCQRLYRSDSGNPVWSYVKTGRLLPSGKPEMKFVRGLANRRQAEYRMCMGAE